MRFSDSDLDLFDAEVQIGLQCHCAGRFRARVAARRRDRLGPLVDAVRERVELRRASLSTEAGREAVVDEVCEAFRSRRDEFGVPVWVFAIILKVLASVIIDLLLEHGSEGATDGAD